MTADPAIAAAQRAMSNPEVEAAWIDGGNDLAIAAAREALAPLRELHQPSDDECRCCKHCIECGSIGMGWPCDTAKLIYPESELP